ncbi:hypothetical protein ABZP36_017878 [Zizania latifolia]
MAAQSPLRRWKCCFAAFSSVDAAIEAANPGLSRDEFRQARGCITEMLCNARDEEEAEEFCLVLDDVMAESLITLRQVHVTSTMLSTTDLAKDVGAMRNHESERVRGLVNCIIRGWKLSVMRDIVRYRAAMDRLSQIPETDPHVSSDLDVKVKQTPWAPKKKAAVDGSSRVTSVKTLDSELSLPKKRVPNAVNDHVKTADMDASTTKPKVSPHPPKEVPAVVDSVGHRESMASCIYDEKMAASKRKLHEGYEKAEETKRERKIHVVEALEMLRQRQKKVHPIMRVRSRARCATSMVEKRVIMSSLRRRM